MQKVLYGKNVKEEIEIQIKKDVEVSKKNGVTPRVAVVRVGDAAGDKYYEKAIIRQAEKYGMESTAIDFDAFVTQNELEEKLFRLNKDDNIHGIIYLMPFPKHIDSEKIRRQLPVNKDIDAVTDESYANILSNKKDSFHACTAESCMEILSYYGYDVSGKKVTVVGRSLTVGKPLALLLMNANATVTVCHSRTSEEDMIAACRNADIVVLATGRIQNFGHKYVRNGQVIIDVGTGVGRDGKMAGDLDIQDIKETDSLELEAYSPVPGGVGTVTTSILLRNVLLALKKGEKSNDYC